MVVCAQAAPQKAHLGVGAHPRQLRHPGGHTTTLPSSIEEEGCGSIARPFG
jgi:hypothetical protein